MSAGEERHGQVVHEHYYGCWGSCVALFGVSRRYASLLWGAVLLAIGGVWMAGNFFAIGDWGKWVGPILLLGIGAGLLLDRRSGSEDGYSSGDRLR